MTEYQEVQAVPEDGYSNWERTSCHCLFKKSNNKLNRN